MAKHRTHSIEFERVVDTLYRRIVGAINRNGHESMGTGVLLPDGPDSRV